MHAWIQTSIFFISCWKVEQTLFFFLFITISDKWWLPERFNCTEPTSWVQYFVFDIYIGVPIWWNFKISVQNYFNFSIKFGQIWTNIIKFKKNKNIDRNNNVFEGPIEPKFQKFRSGILNLAYEGERCLCSGSVFRPIRHVSKNA